MNLTVNIDINNEQFEKMCADNINNLPEDKMQEILLKAVETAPIQNNSSNIFVGKVGFGEKPTPTPLMNKVLENIDTEKYFKPIADEIAQYMADNYREFIKEYMVEAIGRMFIDEGHIYQIMQEFGRGMKKIIDKHHNKYRLICDYYSCLFSYSREDILESFIHNYVDCPNCKRVLQLKEAE